MILWSWLYFDSKKSESHKTYFKNMITRARRTANLAGLRAFLMHSGTITVLEIMRTGFQRSSSRTAASCFALYSKFDYYGESYKIS